MQTMDIPLARETATEERESEERSLGREDEAAPALASPCPRLHPHTSLVFCYLLNGCNQNFSICTTQHMIYLQFRKVMSNLTWHFLVSWTLG